MHDAAGCPEKLPLLRQERGGLPAGAVALHGVSGGIKALFVVILENGDLGLAFLAHHHAPDHAALVLGHPAQVGIKRQLVAALHQLVEGHGFRAAVLILRLVDNAALEEELLPLDGIIALGNGLEHISVPVKIGDLHTPRIHHGGGVPGVVVVAGAVWREAASGGGKFTLDGLLHHGKLHPGAPAHGMSAADGLHGAEFADAHQVGIEQPHPGGAGHGEDRRLCPEDHDLARARIHADGADAPFLSVLYSRQEAGGLGVVADGHAQALHLIIKSRFERRTPYPQGKTVLIVIGEHELRLVIAELSALEFILRIPDLAAEALQIQQAVIPLTALDIMRDAVGIVILLVHIRLRDLLRRHAGTGIGAGGFPVVKAGTAGAAALCSALFHQHDLLSPARSGDGSKASCEAAAQHRYIRSDDLLLPEFIGIGPFHLLHNRSPFVPESVPFLLVRSISCIFRLCKMQYVKCTVFG